MMTVSKLIRIIAMMAVLPICQLCVITSAPASVVGYWRLDETNGMTASDDSPNGGHDGTLVNWAGDNWWWMPGQRMNALYFDGTANSYIHVPNHAALQITGDLTIALWVKPAALPVGYNRFMWVDKCYGGEFGLWQYFDSCVILIQGKEYNSGQYYSAKVIAEGKIVPKEWQHVAVTRNMATREIKGYLNGVLQNTCIYPDNAAYSLPRTTSNPVRIGANWCTPYFEGLLDDVLIADHAFTPEEVATLYHFHAARGWWDMNEGVGTIAEDFSDYAHVGAIYGATRVAGHPEENGYFTNALHFDGDNDYVDFRTGGATAPNLSFTGTDPWTLTAWVRWADNPTNTYEYWIGKIGGYEQFIITTISGGKIMFRQDGGSYATLMSTGYLAHKNQWAHHAYVADGAGYLSFYLNGALQSTVTANTQFHLDRIGIPYTWGPGKYHFFGDMDKIRMHSRALSADEILAMQPLSAYANQTYYTDESEGYAVAKLKISAIGELAANCYLVSKNSAGNELGAHVTPGLETDVPFNAALLPVGVNAITIELRKNSGIQERLAMTTINVTKRAPKPGYEVKVDRKHGRVLRNGAPFFPIGVYMYNIPAAAAADFNTVSDAGFNTIIHWNFKEGDPAIAATYMQAAANAGLLAVDTHQAYDELSFAGIYKYNIAPYDYPYPYQSFWDAYHYTTQGYLENMGYPYNTSLYTSDKRSIITQAVEYARNEPNLLAYYTFDEPNSNQVAAGQDLYQATNERDGYHPTFCLYTTIPEGDQYTDWGDILGVDPYWTPPAATLHTVAGRVWYAAERARQDKKALWIVPMSQFWSGCTKRACLPDEQYCQTYLSLIHGAKGILFWHYTVYHRDSWIALTNMAYELNVLADFMVAPDIQQHIAYSEWSASAQAYIPDCFYPPAGMYPDIHLCLRKADTGGYVLLAANAKHHPVNVTFNIAGLGNVSVSCPFSQYSATAVNGEFSDQLAGFGRRAYMFAGTLPEPVAIQVQMTAQPDVNPEPTPYTRYGRTGYKNLMQNPTLEDNTLPNWPDYSWPIKAPNPRISEPNQAMGLATITDATGLPANSGPQCMQVINPTVTTNGFYFWLMPQHTVAGGQNYTFSAYLKTDGAKQVRIGSSLLGSTTFTVGTTWERRSITKNIPPNWTSNNLFYIYLCEQGTLSVEAVQLEAGDTATVFEP